MNEYFWELVERDGTRHEIPPSAQQQVTRWISQGEPIRLRLATIPAAQVSQFRQTDKPFNPQPLLDAAAQAFNEEVINPDGSIVCAWVKREVTRRSWEKHYAPLHYKTLGESGGMVIIAMFIPIHDIDTSKMQYCTKEEVNKLSR